MRFGRESCSESDLVPKCENDLYLSLFGEVEKTSLYFAGFMRLRELSGYLLEADGGS